MKIIILYFLVTVLFCGNIICQNKSDEFIYVIGSVQENDTTLFYSTVLFNRQQDSLINVNSFNFRASDSLIKKLQANNRITFYRAGEKIGSADYYEIEYPTNYVKINKVSLLKSIPFGYENTQDYKTRYICVGTTNENICNLKTKNIIPSNDDHENIKNNTYKYLQNHETRPFSANNIRIERLDKIHDKLTDETILFSITTLTFDIERYEKIDRHYVFSIINLDSCHKKTEFIDYVHIKQFYEGYGKYLSFIDIFDFDNDGKYEILALEQGYEHKMVYVLKRKNGSWVKIKEINISIG